MELAINKNAVCYYNSAEDLFLPVDLIYDIEGFALHLGDRHYFFRGGETPWNSSCSTNIATNKYCANRILNKAGIPVPKAIALHIDDFTNGHLENIISDLSFPLVIKPSKDGRLGKDVICNIPNLEQLKALLAKTFPRYEFLSIEEFHGNLNSYRVLVFNQKIIGIVQRFPAQVFGDGEQTITELVASANLKRREISDTLKPIVIDDECHIRLKQLGITPDYVPKCNEKVVLCYTCNATRGGTYVSLNTKICKKNRKLFINAARALNLNLAGVDVECADINVPIETSKGVIIEVNPSPSVRIHEHPMVGKPVRVTKKIVRGLIYRHPLSYLRVLYNHKRSAFYIRSLMLLPLLAFLYKLLD